MVAALDGTLSLFAGAVALGLVHGAEPGHGWPVAAAYALDRRRTWFHGLSASILLGLGHLVSSVAVVAVFFLAKDYFGLTELGWVRYVAGVLLIGLGVREYRHGHSHSHSDGHSHSQSYGHEVGYSHSQSHGHEDGHSPSHSHEHDDASHSHSRSGEDSHSHSHADGEGHSHADDVGHSHSHGDSHSHDTVQANGTGPEETVGGDPHGHVHLSTDDVDEKGLWGIVGTAFVLGFAHEEEFEIIGLCLGSSYCLELMLVYAVAVLVALVALTLSLVAGFEHYGERVEQYTEHLPTISAVVLIAIGFGFIFGVI